MKKILKKALVIVDPQNDFFPGGSLGVPHGTEILTPINNMIAHALKRKWLIIVSRDWHPEETDHFKKWPVHCVQKTFGAAFHSELHIPPSSVIISKGMTKKDDAYSPFQGFTEKGKTLDDVLRKHKITTLYVTGLATDYCVKACVLDAQGLGYNSIVLADAVRAVNINPTDGYAATLEMRAAFAHVTNTEEVLNEKQ